MNKYDRINKVVTDILNDGDVSLDSKSLTFLGQNDESRNSRLKQIVETYLNGTKDTNERNKYISMMHDAPQPIFHKTLQYIHSSGLVETTK
jgi:hypothetical protein